MILAALAAATLALAVPAQELSTPDFRPPPAPEASGGGDSVSSLPLLIFLSNGYAPAGMQDRAVNMGSYTIVFGRGGSIAAHEGEGDPYETEWTDRNNRTQRVKTYPRRGETPEEHADRHRSRVEALERHFPPVASGAFLLVRRGDRLAALLVRDWRKVA
jgi:hypothetical protein